MPILCFIGLFCVVHFLRITHLFYNLFNLKLFIKKLLCSFIYLVVISFMLLYRLFRVKLSIFLDFQYKNKDSKSINHSGVNLQHKF